MSCDTIGKSDIVLVVYPYRERLVTQAVAFSFA